MCAEETELHLTTAGAGGPAANINIRRARRSDQSNIIQQHQRDSEKLNSMAKSATAAHASREQDKQTHTERERERERESLRVLERD